MSAHRHAAACLALCAALLTACTPTIPDSDGTHVDVLGSMMASESEINAVMNAKVRPKTALRSPMTNANYELVQHELQHKRLQWPDVQQQFVDGLLSWTEAFQALMNKCGYSMEDALRCLAENFDRRPAVNVKEV